MIPTEFQSIRIIQEKINKGELSCRTLVEQYLHEIKNKQHLNIYVEVFEAESLHHADALDAKRIKNPESVGRLHGVIISIKDVICLTNHTVTAASKILDGFKSSFTATAIQRLLDEDAIIIGRVNCDQFAMGSSNENSIYGATRNPHAPDRVPGGSSGASAAAVAANTCLLSIGSDTGGSVRQPAGFCGVVGTKPTYGRVSRYGLLAYASSFDQLGILSHNVEDAALVLEIMSGADAHDSTTSVLAVEKYIDNINTYINHHKKSKIAYFGSALNNESVHPEIKTAISMFIDQLKTAGHTVESVEFELLDYMIPAYYVLTTAEASSNLSRYDGVRYGYRSKEARSLEEVYANSRTEGFSEEVKKRIMLGTFVLSSGYYDAYYSKAQKARRRIRDLTLSILEEYDFILMPVSPTPPWKIGEKTDDAVSMYLADVYTVQANMAGIPAVALPIGKHPDGLPIGVQFMANKFEENKLLSFSHYIFKDFCVKD